MVKISFFTFNPFQENTYILSDETKECVIIDPGCYDKQEQETITKFIEDNGLKPVKLLNTHCHIDHVFGNRFIFNKYGFKPEIHEKDLIVLNSLLQVGALYNLKVEESPAPAVFLDEKDIISFGNSKLSILFTPGHSPGSICFMDKEGKSIIAGDVLFQGSIGRTDLPGGDYDTLINSIKTKLFPLADDFKVYPGHGPATTIGQEKRTNPFLQ